MSLTPGTLFGPYEILTLIGAGGMGEVYRAHDKRLKRDVALKVLPEAFAADPERLSRFKREAEVLASLNHPNIAQIYGVEERALAMELVEGDSPLGPLSFDDAWKIVYQIANALEYAHDKGIVHRDLKPANVKVTAEGTVKLLDFGLAKGYNDLSEAYAGDSSNSPTLSLGATSAGVIIGTPAYMAPEQAKGKSVDKRADIWAWGVLFYELLTGQRLFDAENASEIFAQVLTKQPELERLPPRARHLLRECLQKDPRERLRDIGDAKRMVPNDELSSSIPHRSHARVIPWIISGAAIVIVAGALLNSTRQPRARQPSIVRFATSVTALPVGMGLLAVSPDGAQIAFVSGDQRQIYVRAIDQFESRSLAGTEGSMSLSFSPDGSSISYVTGYPSAPTVIKRIALSGGSPQTITSVPTLQVVPSQSWGADDNIYFSADAGLMRVAYAGGKPELIAALDPRTDERAYVNPELLPDQRHVLLSTLLLGRGPTAHRLQVFDIQSREKKTLIEDAGLATFAAGSTARDSGILLYYAPTTGSIMAVALDLTRMAVQGSAVPALEGVRSSGAGGGRFAFSQSGTVAYVPGAPLVETRRTLLWVNREGGERPASCPSPRQYNNPRLSPDNRHVVLEIQNPARGQADVWICDLDRGSLAKITSANSNVLAFWSGNDRVIYSSVGGENGAATMSAPVDGGPPQVLSREPFSAYSVSADGKTLIGNSGLRALEKAISILRLESNSKASTNSKPVDLAFPGVTPQFSPDGKFIAYQSMETGRTEIYVREYPGPGGKTTISTEGGTNPRWSRNGELFYTSGDNLMGVDIQTTPTFRAGNPKVLFQKRYSNGYDVTADGKQFLMVKSDESPREARTEQINVVLNWLEELHRRLHLR